jgi:hypothetical protein
LSGSPEGVQAVAEALARIASLRFTSRCFSIRVSNHPGARQKRCVKKGLAPLKRDSGTRRDDGYPYQE